MDSKKYNWHWRQKIIWLFWYALKFLTPVQDAQLLSEAINNPDKFYK